MDETRVGFLLEALASNPDDTFARYALALELTNSDHPVDAWPHFEYLLNHHPDYLPTYYQAGRFLATQNRQQEACAILAKGIEVARHQGNVHAQSEMEAALGSLAD